MFVVSRREWIPGSLAQGVCAFKLNKNYQMLKWQHWFSERENIQKKQAWKEKKTEKLKRFKINDHVNEKCDERMDIRTQKKLNVKVNKNGHEI